MSLVLIHPAPDSGWAGQRLNGVLRQALAGKEVRVLRTAEELTGIAGERLLLALPLGDTGINLEYMRMLVRLRKERSLLQGCTAGLIVDGAGELYTKSAAAEAALALNRAGCALVGRPLVEGTGSLANFQVQANNLGVDLMGAYRHAAQELAERVEGFVFPKKERPEVLILHASSHHTSNTMDLWSQVREKLEERCAIREIGLRNGTLSDCSGCPYTMCLHFGEQGGCFYGPAVPQLQRRPVRQPHRLHQPPHRPVPPDPVLRQGSLRHRRVRLLRGRHGGPADHRCNEYEQVLLPPAEFFHDQDRQLPRSGSGPARHSGAAGALWAEHPGHAVPITESSPAPAGELFPYFR